MADTLTAQLQQFVGRRSYDPSTARDPVNQPMIRHWCDAIGDRLPVYTDPAAAAASVHGEIVAPPTMLQAWTMGGLGQPMPASSTPPGQIEMMELFAEHGFTSVVATNCEQEYFRYLRLGDHLTAEATIDAISDEKETALGTGHFVTTKTTYTDQHGEVVAQMTFRILKFRPRTVA